MNGHHDVSRNDGESTEKSFIIIIESANKLLLLFKRVLHT